MFYFISFSFFLCALLSYFLPSFRRYRTVGYFFALTTFLMALFYHYDGTAIHIFRYFMFLIGGLSVIVMPFLLILLMMLGWSRSRELENDHHLKKIGYWLIVIVLLTIIFITITSIMARRNFDIYLLINIYTGVAIFFGSSFLAYLGVTIFYHLNLRQAGIKALLVLGAEVDDAGNISHNLKQRLMTARDLYDSTKIIIVSGGLVKSREVTEAQQMKAFLMKLGIPEQGIYREDRATSTYENLLFSQKILTSLQIDASETLIVSNSFHLLRTHYYADYLNLNFKYYGTSTSWYLLPFSLIREYVALLLLTKEINFGFTMFMLIAGLIQLY